MDTSTEQNYSPVLISDEDMAGIRDATIDMCRAYQKHFAEHGGSIEMVDVVAELQDESSKNKFFTNYAATKSMTVDAVLELKELEGFAAMGALISMLESSKYGGK